MKKQLLTIISILTLATLAHSKECTPEMLAGAWMRSDKMPMEEMPTCGKATYTSVDRFFLFNIDGVLSGHGFSESLMSYAKCPGIRTTVEFPKVKLMNSQISIQDDLGDVRLDKCDASADGQTVTFGEAEFKRIQGSQAGSTYNSKTNEKTKAVAEMGDWAPAPQAPQAVKTYAKPVQTTNSNR